MKNRRIFSTCRNTGRSLNMRPVETRVIKLCCQGCGADLEVDDSIRFLTCNYCHSKLEVVRDASTTHTRVLEKIEETTQRMEGSLKVIELQNDLATLDREWESFRQTMLVRSEHGDVSEPSSPGNVVRGVVLIIGGIVWMVFASSMGAPGIFPLFGLLFIGAAIIGMVRSTTKAGEYSDVKAEYQAKRSSLLTQLEMERRK